MDPKNHEYLTERLLPRLGFDRVLDNALKDQSKGESFTLKALQVIGEAKMTYELKFERNKKDDLDPNYYLNQIKATIDKPTLGVHSHTFQVFNQNAFTAREMFNMMEGRHVYREFMHNGDLKKTWNAPNLNKFDDNGNTVMYRNYENKTGFNLFTELAKVNLSNTHPDEKERVMREMRSGEMTKATIRMDGQRVEVFLVAEPVALRVGVFNKEGKRMDVGDNSMKVVAGKEPEGNAKGTVNNAAISMAADIADKATQGRGASRKAG